MTTTDLFPSYAAYLARIGDVPMRVGQIDGQWRLARNERGWRLMAATMAVFDAVADEPEQNRVRDWLQRDVLGVREVALHRDTRAPGVFVVSVEK